ncbi:MULTISPECIES: hypothetical protein [unclassified Mesorhizobium]|uniref:hypothetical protein n=1 Tax=unclassified Mesorhizobium TaxID=325217 RepID=UPI000FCBFDF7|nr:MULTISPECIES: hypothetical protein [unclassified Mesorhizobium]TGP24472.1 hypothetical protein EN874_012525 [Mesorhizobium sp. M1D.F.Ca.ET.231.01.1.1]TGP34940.1 hypothetical protein EN877_09565 [Mesorhizobium sp. M1D.F.Ca.ET.234.01.1.1]TGS48963.1 hypothetical protein EN827_09565 [Mesorhizobium sp. M1D.F.Ca.ET.184.01.1.1]TGS63163.1 hypothetical protein EN826_009565 [Mesorhizobium sp. M1D.F.Ca.ET.183.01.1.1]
MRLFFPNPTRPKKAAKLIADKLGLRLSSVHHGIARACGYTDWYEFNRNLSASAPSPLDQELSHSEFIERQSYLSLALAHELAVPDGDAQYALSVARLTGDRQPLLGDQIAIRLKCWQMSVLPLADARTRGAMGKLKTRGRNGEPVILLNYGRPTQVVTHQEVTTIADFEYVTPRAALPLFLPMRLYLPYGYWTEQDGAEVFFSRDYKPMWRIRTDGDVERLEPWLWIKVHGETHLWEDVRTPWHSPVLKTSLEKLLADRGLQALPILADALPVLVNETNAVHQYVSLRDGIDLLEQARRPVPEAAE